MGKEIDAIVAILLQVLKLNKLLISFIFCYMFV